MYHSPVLLKESIEGLNIRPNGIYVDVTFGGGGHSKEILKALGDDGRLIAFDQDQDALINKIKDERFMLIEQNFRYMKNFLKLHGITQVDGILADLGVSSHQFDQGERGFSTRFEGGLDMRMNQEAELSAIDVVNTYSEGDLKKLFKTYGDLKNAGRVARVIAVERSRNKISTTQEFKNILMECAPKGREHQFFAKVFQSLRIVVNDELGALEELLVQTNDVIKVGGRLVVISYHSLEDRIVKNFIRSGNESGDIEKDFYGKHLVPFKAITRKPMVPDDNEIEKNNRARSAKLRIAEKVEVNL